MSILIYSLLAVASVVVITTRQTPRLTEVQARVLPKLKADCAAAGVKWGSAIEIRTFKESHELELWVWRESSMQLFRSYKIANWGRGKLGPKLKEGDGQAPEGFYEVGPDQMNPNSNFHLAFNLGFPNAYDRYHGRTGSFLMVHGSHASVGCYAMTDASIEEIYCLADAAHAHGQKAFRVQSYPFRMTPERLAKEASSPWFSFWQNLAEGDALFLKKQPFAVEVKDGRYQFTRYTF
jgi:murein L,D-transpeptidase YafK